MKGKDMSSQEFIEIGRILKPFGVKGELKVLFYIDEVSDLEDVDVFYIKDKKEISGFREMKFSSLKFSENPEYAKIIFTDVVDRTVAESWRLVPIYVKKDNLSLPEDGEYFIKDLLGLKAIYQDQEIGVIFNVFEVANQELFVVKQHNSKLDLAIPFNDYYVSLVSLEEQKIVFNHLDELL